MLEWQKCDLRIEFIDLGLCELELWVNTFKSQGLAVRGRAMSIDRPVLKEAQYAWGIADSETSLTVGGHADFEEAKKDALRYVRERLQNILAELPGRQPFDLLAAAKWAEWEKSLDKLETAKQDRERLVSQLGFERPRRINLEEFLAAFYAEWEDELPGAAIEQLRRALEKG